MNRESSLGGWPKTGGGVIAGNTSVLDERLKATVLSGCANTFKGSILAI